MPACIVCRTPLRKAEQQTCHDCLLDTGQLLSGIVTMWTELPQHLGHLHGPRLRLAPSAGGGSGVPGGDALVLAGPGGLGILNDWALMWGGGESRNAYAAARFLAGRMTWAAREHDRFGEFHTDLQQLHGRLERATGRAIDIVRANIDCLDCRRPLVKQLDEVGRQLETFTCEGCGRTYTDQQYRMVLRAEVERRSRVVIDGVEYGAASRVAAMLGRPVATVRSWERSGLIRRLDRDGQVLVAVDDAEREHQVRPMRERRAS